MFRRLIATALVAASLLTAGSAAAAESTAVNIDDAPPPITSPRSVKLFDNRRNLYGLEVGAGPLWYRAQREGEMDLGVFALELGQATTSYIKPFYLTGLRQTQFRMFDTKSYSWSLLTHTICAGVKLGPFEPEVRTGLSLLSVDVFRGNYSAQMLSPRIGVHLGVKVAKFRFDIGAYSEYLWRWFGPSYYVRGFTFGIRLDTARPKDPGFQEGAPGAFPARFPIPIPLPFLQ